MLGNMLNDLAEAIRRWTEKKLLLAILTGRSNLCIAGVFGAGKTRSLAVLLIALSCELSDFYAIVYTKENVAAKVLADQISDLAPPTRTAFGRLLGRIEEGDPMAQLVWRWSCQR